MLRMMDGVHGVLAGHNLARRQIGYLASSL